MTLIILSNFLKLKKQKQKNTFAWKFFVKNILNFLVEIFVVES